MQEVVIDNLLDICPLELEADFIARSEKGIEEYGTPLKTFNDRNALQDLFEELLDAAMYCKQVLMEKEFNNSTLTTISDYESILEKLFEMASDVKYSMDEANVIE